MAETVSIHFQEGFSGETVELWRGEERVGRWLLQTRMQIGLAHIETITVEPGERLRVTLPGTGALTSFVAPDANGAHVILVNHDGHELRVKTTEDEPGYL